MRLRGGLNLQLALVLEGIQTGWEAAPGRDALKGQMVTGKKERGRERERDYHTLPDAYKTCLEA